LAGASGGEDLQVRKLYNAAATYTAAGLVAGVYYREFTKAHSFTGTTELAFVHTHLLALGTLFFLIVMVLEKNFTLTASQWFPLFFITYQVGLVIAATMFTVHGTLDVLGKSSGPVLSWIAGLGHIGLAMGLLMFFLALRERVFAPSDADVSATSEATSKA
jgi:Protein of unknown function (DUF2871)